MAAAYAALVSLRHIIEQIEHHPRPPISLDKSQVQSLIDKITFLQEFLECYSINGGSNEADHHHVLEARITNAAYMAEDIIESHIVDQILSQSITSHVKEISGSTSISEKTSFYSFFCGLWTALRCGEYKTKEAGDHVLESGIADSAYAAEDIIESHSVDQTQAASTTSHVTNISSSLDFYQDLQKVIQEMDLIKTEATKIKETMKVNDQQHRILSSTGSLNSAPMGKNTMVGLDDVKINLMDKLTDQQSRRQIIPIVGMGGIGKTTLAINIYENPLIKHHFDILAWTTISQEHNAKEILLQILLCLKTSGSGESLSEMREHELGEKLHKSLIGRRYLIIMDDIWSIEAWDGVRLFLPDNENGSRIVITTRLSNLAFKLTGSNGIKIDFLDEDKSWDLLRKHVDCPLELEEIGKKIAKNCKGLPLSIVVIGGLLEKSEGTQEQWQYIEENLNSIVKLEDNERCLKILQMSYDHLPIHLKPCFLYMVVYHEDSEIDVSNLIKLWVAEGFLKPIRGKILEEVAEEYFTDLVDRNLVVVSQRKYNGKIKRFKIHDLLMDLCVRETRKGKFVYLRRQHKLDIMSTQRRIVFHEGTSSKTIHALPCASLVRSLTVTYFQRFPELFNYSLLRVCNVRYSPGSACGLVNSRYLNSIDIEKPKPGFPSRFSLFWNIQTLIVDYPFPDTVPSEFWKMSQLRHVKLYRVSLPDPPPSGEMDSEDDEFVLTSLQTLQIVLNFKCSDEVMKRIPNIKKLKLSYDGFEKWASSNFNNLGRLHKLESLFCFVGVDIFIPSVASEFVKNLSFPQSLRKLTLSGTNLQSTVGTHNDEDRFVTASSSAHTKCEIVQRTRVGNS